MAKKSLMNTSLPPFGKELHVGPAIEEACWVDGMDYSSCWCHVHYCKFKIFVFIWFCSLLTH